jgi:GAF domain-containing protein
MKELIINSIQALVSSEKDTLANMANISAVLNDYVDDINWVGFYRTKGNELILGPFQGKLACVHIPYGKGVCGVAAKEKKTLRVSNVHEFDGHIACDSASNSEIVVPLIKDDQCIGVLDIDSPSFDRFTEEDQIFLENLVDVITPYLTCI